MTSEVAKGLQNMGKKGKIQRQNHFGRESLVCTKKVGGLTEVECGGSVVLCGRWFGAWGGSGGDELRIHQRKNPNSLRRVTTKTMMMWRIRRRNIDGDVVVEVMGLRWKERPDLSCRIFE
mmetsp:Transcript_12799/g.28823  ORF Transcript_12799/g.28823 Transcript_12799/m.28823 type:complete len:120 (+) Transcript_12799:80-439(+)